MLSKFMMGELAKKPEERDKAGHFIKACRQEFDRLMETSPNIDSSILELFKKSLTSGKNKLEIARKQKLFNDLNKPEIFDELPSIKDKVYTINIEQQILDEEQENINNILNKKKENDEKKDQINKFKENFLLKFNRQPTLNELITNNKKMTKEEIEILSK